MSVSRTLYEVPAPAKLNLFLHVTGRGNDGYHRLQTVFRLIDLQDRLHFERRNDGKILCSQPTLQGLAETDDLCHRAAQLLQRATGTRYGVSWHCDKRIPAGAGLGGGSSDAASTLIALNRLWGLGLSRLQLMRLGVQLGADVPVFVFGRNAFAQGIGEQLQPITLPIRQYSLWLPNTFLSTPKVFSAKSLTRNTKPVTIMDFAQWQIDQDCNAEASSPVARTKAFQSCALFGHNDLQPVASSLSSEVTAVLQLLQNLGLHARMTGSGSCVFLEFPKNNTAIRQHNQISGRILHLTQSLQPLVKQSWFVDGLDYHPLYTWLN